MPMPMPTCHHARMHMRVCTCTGAPVPRRGQPAVDARAGVVEVVRARAIEAVAEEVAENGPTCAVDRAVQRRHVAVGAGRARHEVVEIAAHLRGGGADSARRSGLGIEGPLRCTCRCLGQASRGAP